MKVKIKSAVEYVFAEQAVLSRLPDCYFKPLDRYRIFCSYVYVALARTGGIAADGHSLYYAVRVALKHGTVHKRAGIALVGVADNVFLLRFLRCGEAPLFTCGEAAAASAPESRLGDNVYNLRGSVFGEALCESRIAVIRYIFVYVFGVYNTAVAKRNAVLFFVEIRLLERLYVVHGKLLEQQPLNYSAL